MNITTLGHIEECNRIMFMSIIKVILNFILTSIMILIMLSIIFRLENMTEKQLLIMLKIL